MRGLTTTGRWCGDESAMAGEPSLFEIGVADAKRARNFLFPGLRLDLPPLARE